MKHISLFSVAFLFSAIFGGEAEARRSGIFGLPGFGGGETIDLVYELPDREPFLRNGEPYDLGYLNSEGNSGYVLYRGERYSKLSDADIARLKATLGFDPTTKHRMEQAAEEQEAPWTRAIVIAAIILGIFVLVHKAIQIVRWISRLSTTSSVKATKIQGEAPPEPLEIRKAQLAKRYRRDRPADPVSRARDDAAAAEEAAVPTRSRTAVRAFGRRNT